MTREVINGDTNEWIKGQVEFDAVITSLPDSEETSMNMEQWEFWFSDMVKEIVERTRTYAIFYQTDRRYNGAIIDKAFLASLGAQRAGARTIFHKIALRRNVGSVDLFRPSYTHLICYSKSQTAGKASPDVITTGPMIYNNAMGMNACTFAVQFIKDHSDAKMIVDPFCGQGSVLAVAESMGFDTIGVEILSEYADLSRQLFVK